MMQTVFGQTDALALAMVNWLTTNAATFSFPMVAERRFALITELPNIPKYNEAASVDVFPAHETSERQGMGAFHSDYAVHLFIQQQVAGSQDEDAQCALLTRLRSEIIEALKPGFFDLANAVHQVLKVRLSEIKSTERGLYDLHRLLEFHVYESDTVLIFKAAA